MITLFLLQASPVEDFTSVIHNKETKTGRYAYSAKLSHTWRKPNDKNKITKKIIKFKQQQTQKIPLYGFRLGFEIVQALSFKTSSCRAAPVRIVCTDCVSPSCQCDIF